MAITVIVQNSQGKAYHGKMTPFVLLACVVAATGGLIFGYDMGILGNIIYSLRFILSVINLYFFICHFFSKVILNTLFKSLIGREM